MLNVVFEREASPPSSVKALPLAVSTVVCAAAVLLLLYNRPFLLTLLRRIIMRLRGVGKGSKIASELPPLAPTSIRQTLSHFFSRDAPLFLLDLSRRTDVGPIYRLPLGPGPGLVVVGEAVAARAVLDDPKNSKPRQPYLLFDMVAGTRDGSFFTEDGARWKHARKATASAFAPNKVERMKAVVRSNVDRFVDDVLREKAENAAAFDVDAEMQRVTTRVIFEAGFNYPIDDTELDDFLRSFQLTYREYGRNIALNPLRRVFPLLFPGSREAKRAVQRLRSMALRMLEKYRSDRRIAVATCDDSSSTERLELLEGTIIGAIDSNDGYASDDQRITDIIVFLAGGFDTTAHTLSWALLELARNPANQKYLYEDLMRRQLPAKAAYDEGITGGIGGGKGGREGAASTPVSSSALQNVIRETLRLHPAAALGSARAIARETQLGRYVLPAGTWAMIPYFVVHRNEAVFDNADSFQPHRWEGGKDGKPPPPSALLPFAAGRRNCLGQALASVELATILERLCSTYEFRVADEGTYDYFVTWKPKGARLIAIRRKRCA